MSPIHSMDICLGVLHWFSTEDFLCLSMGLLSFSWKHQGAHNLGVRGALVFWLYDSRTSGDQKYIKIAIHPGGS